MIKSKELSDPKSCMSKARDDEMTFVLLGRDMAAPVAIAAWAAARCVIGKNEPGDRQMLDAVECAAAMEAESGGVSMPASDFLLCVAIQDLIGRAHSNSVDKGFWDEHRSALPNLPADVMSSKICLMHSELSEMLEGIRKPGPDSHCPEFTSEEIELADLFIRGADYAGARGLRLNEAILAKMRFNATRPHKHGKAI